MRAKALVLVAVLTAALLAPLTALPTPAVAAFDSSPAVQALVRLVGPWYASQVTFQPLAKTAGRDYFRVAAGGHRVLVGGTSPAVQLTGFGWYLKYVAHADISLEGSQLRLPARLPLPAAPIEHTSSVDHRFALNDTNEGYAGAYLSWPQWQHRIDVLALHGINEVLLYEGQEAVYEQAFEQFHYTAAEMRNWIPQPGHQAWWLLQNMCCLSSPISQQLIDRRVLLARQIANQLRSLGMTPVLPGYYGTVPPGFADRNPGAKTVPQGSWNTLPRPDWLDPTNPLFAEVAAAFYQVQTKLFGASTMYKMDLLHEGGVAGTVNVPDASRAVQQALETAHPGAIWAILGWESNPLPDTLKAVDRSKMLVLDGLSEQPNVTDRDKDWIGTPYAFGTIWNFGGHANLGASLADWNQKFHAWQAKSVTALNGIALMPEAIDNNPAAVEFFAELPWQDSAVNMDTWFAQYATARYGGADPHALAAWKILGNTVYNWPPTVDTKHSTALFDDQPSLTNSGSALGYDVAAFTPALGQLLAVDPKLRDNTAYKYDLVDVARQVLANGSRTLLPRIRAAYAAKDVRTFDELSGEWLRQLRLLDSLLGTDSNFLLGSWLAGASAQAASPQEAATLHYDVRSLVTMWASTANLQDYARREWNGLVGDYYAGRWRRYFASLDKAIRTGERPDAIDWKAVAESWSHSNTRYPSQPRGDAYALASQTADIPAGALSMVAEPKGVRPSGTVRVSATFTNQNLNQSAKTVRATLAVPAGYVVRPVATTAHQVAPGGTFTATWTVAVPANAAVSSQPSLSADVSWRSGQRSSGASAKTMLLVTGDVPAPYATVTTNNAGFAQSGDSFSIAGGGADMWRDRDEFGAIYRKNVLTDGQAVTTKVTAQESTSPYARAGLVARNDLAAAGSAGYATIAVTPGHGCLFSWDSDGDGKLDTYNEVGGFAPAVYVRLGRQGGRADGLCSSDGKNWTIVGSAAVAGTDVGLFMSAVNASTGLTGIASFAGYAVDAYAPPSRPVGAVVSVGKPVTALSSEAGNPATAANDGKRTNSPYWGSELGSDGTWWQVDLGSVSDVSLVNVRNYVDGTRFYTYQVLGSVDGTNYFVLGGKSNTNPAVDAGDTFQAVASARYIKVVGLSNSANPSFHLTEVTVRAPAR